MIVWQKPRLLPRTEVAKTCGFETPSVALLREARTALWDHS
jgi:hypothetical protein